MKHGFIAAEQEVFRTIEDNLDTTNVFAFGIGSSVNRHLIEGIARAGQGEPFIVTDPGESPGGCPAVLRIRRGAGVDRRQG